MSTIEQFIVGLLEKVFAALWGELQTWLAQPGNFEKALTYLDEILSSAGINVQPSGTVTPPTTSGSTPAPVTPTPQATTASTPETVSWFKGSSA